MDERPNDTRDRLDELQESLDASDAADAPDIAEQIATVLGERLDPVESTATPAAEEEAP
jgi:hypothetical protein